MKGYKAFDKDMKCRGMQYKENEIFEENVKPMLCGKGLHFCPMPLDVLNYYNLENSVFAEVEALGDMDKGSDKIATNKLHIKSKLSFVELFKAHFELIFTKIEANKNTTNTSGYKAHANTSGNEAHANTSGNEAHANTSGNEAISCAIGFQSRAKAKNGWIVITDWRCPNKNYIENIYSAKVGREILGTKIEPDTWYWFENGEIKSLKDN